MARLKKAVFWEDSRGILYPSRKLAERVEEALRARGRRPSAKTGARKGGRTGTRKGKTMTDRIYEAVRGGARTVDAISEKTGIPRKSISPLLAYLRRKKRIVGKSGDLRAKAAP